MSEKHKSYTRYVLARIEMEVDCRGQDQNPDDHIDAIDEIVEEGMVCGVEYDGTVYASDTNDSDIEIPVKITSTKVVVMLSPHELIVDVPEFRKQRAELIEALRTCAAQSIGPDWTPEQAFAFIKQHAREVVGKVEGESKQRHLADSTTRW